MKMKKKLASVLTVIMLACSLPWQAQAAAPIVSNKPHKAPVATPPAVSEAQPVKAVPEPAAVKSRYRSQACCRGEGAQAGKA